MNLLDAAKRLARPMGCLVAALGLIGHAVAVPSSAAPKPNIIYIMVDELAYYEPGFMGGTQIQTPNIDRLAADGIIFNNLLAGGPVCAPTRACLLTGKHSGHTSVRANDGGTPLRADETTVAALLKRQGYATGGFGKWGVGGRNSTGVPEKHGFDVFFGYYDQVHAHTYYPPYLIRNSVEVPLEGNYGLGKPGKTYAQYLIHDAAMQWIREQAGGPFFAYLPYTPPHGIHAIPESDPAWEIYKDKPWPKEARTYAAMVTMLDREVGEIRALVKELGIEKNTLIVFSGDNGSQDQFADAERPRGFFGGNKHPKTGVEFRGTKGTLYDGALRVSYAACWPGTIAPGRVSNYVGYFPDVLPTLTELVGAETPADVDGISFVPELIGEAAAGRKQQQHDYLYWEYRDWTAVRQGNWRAVKPTRKTSWELYDLASDPSETTDLAASQPEILAKLKGLAAQAHEPVREGVFTSRDLHERDRRAKMGRQDEAGSPPNHKKT
jgi:arylsulfatase A-like enzyme